MNEKSPESQLSVQKTRLLRMRFPLLAFLALNAALVAAIPFVRSKASSDAGKTQIVQSQPADPGQAAQPGHETTLPDEALTHSTPLGGTGQPRTARRTRQGIDPAEAREMLKQELERQAAAQREQLSWNRVAAKQFAESSVLATYDSTFALSELLADGTAKFVRLATAGRTNSDESVARAPAAQGGTTTGNPREIKLSAPNVEGPAEIDSLVVFNSPDTGGDVSFLANGVAYCLKPGQSQELTTNSSWSIHFHRGDTFGNARYSFSRGTFMFHVTPHGWELSQVPAAMSVAQPR